MKTKMIPFTHVRDAKKFTRLAHLNLVRNPGVPLYQVAAKAASQAYVDTRAAYLAQDETANIILDGMLAGTISADWDAVRDAHLAVKEVEAARAEAPRNRNMKALVEKAQAVYAAKRTAYLTADQNSILLLEAMLSETA